MKLLINATATGEGDPVALNSAASSVQATVTGSGSVSATVEIYASNDEIGWKSLFTFSLSGTDSDTASMAIGAPYNWLKADLTAISGTGATVNVTGRA